MRIQDVRAIAYQTVGVLLLIIAAITALVGVVLLIAGSQDCTSFSGSAICDARNYVLKSQAIACLVAAFVLSLAGAATQSKVHALVTPPVDASSS